MHALTHRQEEKALSAFEPVVAFALRKQALEVVDKSTVHKAY